MPILGIGDATVIATVILFSIWVVIIDTQAGVTHVKDSLVEMGRIFGCSRWKIIFWIVIPSAMPEIITGIRLSVVRAVKGVIVGQIVIALIGFGGLFNTYLSYFLMERFWGLIIVVFIMSFTIIGLVEMLERRIATLLGSEFIDNSVFINEISENFKFMGYIGIPTFHHSNTNNQFKF